MARVGDGDDHDDDDGGKRRRDHAEFVLTCDGGPVSLHAAHPPPLPLTLGRRPQPNTRGRKKGQPGAMGSHHGAKLSSIPLYTHTYTLAIPILIPHAPLTSLLKHRSKSPDWSQRLRNK